MSLTVKPLSAIIEMPGLSSSFIRKLDTLVSSTSEMDPMKTGDTKLMAPFGVQAIKNFAVLWYLYWLHIEDCVVNFLISVNQFASSPLHILI